MKSLYTICKTGVLLLLSVCSLMMAFGQEGFNPADLLKARTGTPSLVNDYTNILTPDQKQALENKLVALDDSTSTQISVVIVPTVGSYTISDYNVELLRAWGVGGKKDNNGVILLIAKDDRKLDITVGYGLEGALPDATAKSIIDDVIVPNFKENDYYRGIDEGSDAIIAAVKGQYHSPKTNSDNGISGGHIFVIVFMLFVFLLSSRGKKGGSFMSRRGASGLPGPLFWPSGGGSSSGESSGGFGGFDGGSGGGGGASGSW